MEYISGNVFIRRMEGATGFAPGAVISGHAHNFDHTSILFSGRWRVRKWKRGIADDGTEVWVTEHDFERDGPFSLLIEAAAKHEFTFINWPVPAWMEPFLAKLSPEDATVFRAQHEKSLGHGWCIYSHRTPQGDISEVDTGWHHAYA